MTSQELRQKFIEFYEKRTHQKIDSASLVPQNDPTTLFTGSGMQPLLPYLLGKSHPNGNKLVDSQRCFRSEDIDEVGDNRHTTCFEMLGNWSLGDYFKKEQLSWVFNFLTVELKIDPNKLFVSVFIGEPELNLERDDESGKIWQELFKNTGIDALLVELGSLENAGKNGMQNGRIFFYDSSKNWWSRAGKPQNMPEGEPGGPDSEIFYEFTNIQHNQKFGEHCHPNCDCGRYMEIGNSVFMQYQKLSNGTFATLPQKNVDFGGGLERMVSAVADDPDIFKIDIFAKLINIIEENTGKKYSESDEITLKAFRILADHIRGAAFILGEKIAPSNIGRGYILRRLIRRAIRFAKLANIYNQNIFSKLIQSVIESNEYLSQQKDFILKELEEEETKFIKTLAEGTKEFERLIAKNNHLSGQDAFNLFTAHGFPLELTIELATEKNLTVDIKEFEKEFLHHQEVSRAGVNAKFGGHGVKDEEHIPEGITQEDLQKIKMHHTATHMLQQALREVLGDHISQKGSDVAPDRLRFDFANPTALTESEKIKVEDLVNSKIKENLPVFSKLMTMEEARETGALAFFDSKYGDKVKVYFIGNIDGQIWSKELCGGPHVNSTGELKHFKIISEKSSSSGIRRIKAVVG